MVSWLQQVQVKRGSQAELMREALARYARRSVRHMLKGVAQYRSGRSDISERAEQILRRAAKERLLQR